jgi:hypothetical protein
MATENDALEDGQKSSFELCCLSCDLLNELGLAVGVPYAIIRMRGGQVLLETFVLDYDK